MEVLTTVGLLALAALALAGATAASASRPAEVLPTHDALLDGWQALHGGYDPRASAWVRGWLALTHRLAAPLARRGVRPDLLTLWTVWLGLAALAAAWHAGGWLVLAALLVVASGAADGLDGTVALLTDRATRWGRILDSLADRVTEVAYVAAVWLAGAPAWLAVATAGVIGLLEYVRARAAHAGLSGVVAVTVGERPVRVVCCAGALLSAGLWPAAGATLATIWLAVLAVLSAAGLGQLVTAVHRALR